MCGLVSKEDKEEEWKRESSLKGGQRKRLLICIAEKVEQINTWHKSELENQKKKKEKKSQETKTKSKSKCRLFFIISSLQSKTRAELTNFPSSFKAD